MGFFVIADLTQTVAFVIRTGFKFHLCFFLAL